MPAGPLPARSRNPERVSRSQDARRARKHFPAYSKRTAVGRTPCVDSAAHQALIQTNQVHILANQEKLDKILTNQSTIENNQVHLLANQDRIFEFFKEVLATQREILENQKKIPAK